ncbi:fibronectin type III domain-containing protein [Hamadaea sp. NPDC051192]|uniref:fibronectin type III domain-containing protein n=1 Tax=Hamadaea sp. NPDC051192 TaxID=3154940 RepID=UPI00343E3CF2
MTTDETPGPGRLAGMRPRLVVAVLVLASAGLLGLVLTDRSPAASNLEFAQAGHWVYNDSRETAYHVDGSTNQVDVQVTVPGGEAGSLVAQGDQSGYVVGRSRITEFDKSTLTVEASQTPPATERPEVIEVAGGPYLVYRNAGQVVRLGDPTATVPAGGPLSRPAVTSHGSMWLHRIDTGSLCELASGATRMTCVAQVAQGHTGSVTIVDDRPVLVDTTADTLQTFGKEGFGKAVPIGVDLPLTAQVAGGVAAGRLAIVDPERGQLHLIDTAGLQSRPVAKPVAVDLPPGGRFADPVATPQVIAVLDQVNNELTTYDSSGVVRSRVPLVDAMTSEPVRGEDNRIYLDGADGTHVLVVNGENGVVTKVAVGGTSPHPTTTSTPPRQTPTTGTSTAPGQPGGASVPGAPRNVTATAGDRTATVRWSPPASNGSPVTAYRLSWPGGSTRVGGSATSATVSLANGTTHVITVTAENGSGRGPGTGVRVTMPSPAAGKPVITVQVPSVWFGTRPITVVWARPALHGATLVHYVVKVPDQPDQTVTTEKATYANIFNTTAAITVTVYAVTRYGSGSQIKGGTGSALIPAVVPMP